MQKVDATQTKWVRKANKFRYLLGTSRKKKIFILGALSMLESQNTRHEEH